MVRFTASLLAMTYIFKLSRVASGWLSAFMAAKSQQDAYVNQVYMSQTDPPPLTNMLATFMLMHIMFSMVLFACVLGVSHIVDLGPTFTTKLTVLAAIDFGCEMIVTLILGTVLATIMTDKRYFSYRYEGLRAIRAYREVLVTVTGVDALTPYFLAAPDWLR